jgi:hypothetical protein
MERIDPLNPRLETESISDCPNTLVTETNAKKKRQLTALMDFITNFQTKQLRKREFTV